MSPDCSHTQVFHPFGSGVQRILASLAAFHLRPKWAASSSPQWVFPGNASHVVPGGLSLLASMSWRYSCPKASAHSGLVVCSLHSSTAPTVATAVAALAVLLLLDLRSGTKEELLGLSDSDDSPLPVLSTAPRLDPETAASSSWIGVRGPASGSTPSFRISPLRLSICCLCWAESRRRWRRAISTSISMSSEESIEESDDVLWESPQCDLWHAKSLVAVLCQGGQQQREARCYQHVSITLRYRS